MADRGLLAGVPDSADPVRAARSSSPLLGRIDQRLPTLRGMSAVHAVILIGGSTVLITLAVTVMSRINQSERHRMERRRQAWIDAGSIPEDEPNFFSGSSGSSFGS